MHAYAYDRLFTDPFFARVMRLGIVPVARMTAAAPKATHVEVDSNARVRKANRKQRRRGVKVVQKKRLRTFLDASAEALPRLHVSAGRRGLEVELAPADLLRLTTGNYAAIGKSR